MNLSFLTIIIILTISLMVSLVILLSSFFLSESEPDNENVSVYECGFDPFHNPGNPFSISFFLIAILFLVFDLEISFLYPWSVGSNIINLHGQTTILLFLSILSGGLLYEWLNGGLEWD